MTASQGHLKQNQLFFSWRHDSGKTPKGSSPRHSFVSCLGYSINGEAHCFEYFLYCRKRLDTAGGFVPLQWVTELQKVTLLPVVSLPRGTSAVREAITSSPNEETSTFLYLCAWLKMSKLIIKTFPPMLLEKNWNIDHRTQRKILRMSRTPEKRRACGKRCFLKPFFFFTFSYTIWTDT